MDILTTSDQVAATKVLARHGRMLSTKCSPRFIGIKGDHQIFTGASSSKTVHYLLIIVSTEGDNA